MKRTKIIATLGPASNRRETIEELIAAGVDVFRLNFSHGDHAGHEKVFRSIRAAARSLGRYTAIMMDLQGPKIRVGDLKDGAVTLSPRKEIK
ncbi:MAG TPA: pyruvate kinase, partial [bacterium]|nr:pyruvate kinase [bacterium]